MMEADKGTEETRRDFSAPDDGIRADEAFGHQRLALCADHSRNTDCDTWARNRSRRRPEKSRPHLNSRAEKHGFFGGSQRCAIFELGELLHPCRCAQVHSVEQGQCTTLTPGAMTFLSKLTRAANSTTSARSFGSVRYACAEEGPSDPTTGFPCRESPSGF